MQKVTVQRAATSVSINVWIEDGSGAGVTTLAYDTSGLTAYYCRPGAVGTAIVLVTQTVTGAYSSGGFVEIDPTNMPGWYRLDVPNAVCAAGVHHASLHLQGVAGMAETPVMIDFANDLALATITGGAYALDTDANGRIRHVVGTAAGELDTTGGVVTIDRTVINGGDYPLDTDANGRVRHVVGTGAGELASSSGQVRPHINVSDQVETGLSLLAFYRRAAAALFGKVSGCDTNAPVFRNMGDSVDRLTCSTDAYGNRTAVTPNDG